MKPVLIVEGIRKNIVTMNYRDEEVSDVMVRDEQGELQTYYDEKHASYINNQFKVDLKKSLVWENRYSPIIDAIHKRINAYEEQQIDIAQQYIESDKPFVDDLRKEYMDLGQKVEGLIETLGIIRELETGQTLYERVEQFAKAVSEMFNKGVPSTDEK